MNLYKYIYINFIYMKCQNRQITETGGGLVAIGSLEVIPK